MKITICVELMEQLTLYVDLSSNSLLTAAIINQNDLQLKMISYNDFHFEINHKSIFIHTNLSSKLLSLIILIANV